MKFPLSRSILLIAIRQIGDVLLTTPLLRSIRIAYPKAKLDVLVYTGTEGMLLGNSDQDDVIVVSEHPSFSEYKTLLKRIFRQYELAISVQATDRAMIYALLSAKKRVGLVPFDWHRTWWKRLLLDAWIELDNTNTHTVLQNLQLSDVLEIPRCYEIIPPSDKNSERVLDRIIPFLWRVVPFVVVHPCPMWRYKQWTVKSWRSLIKELEQRRLVVIITGGSGQSEKLYVQDLLNEPETHAINLVGQLTLAELTRLLRAAQHYVGPDTAITHLAAAIGIPTVALYGPTNPVKWGPWPRGFISEHSPYQQRAPHQQIENVTVIQGVGDCVPCHQEGCDRHKGSESACLQTLPVESVLRAIRKPLTSVDYPSVNSTKNHVSTELNKFRRTDCCLLAIHWWCTSCPRKLLNFYCLHCLLSAP